MTSTTRIDRVNILLVDDQPAKLLSYETILSSLGETLITVTSATEALECLLKNEIAVVLVDVCMPDLDGYELAAMIRQHPRFQQTAIIFVSAVMLNDLDRLRGYECGAVDYVPVPVVPGDSAGQGERLCGTLSKNPCARASEQRVRATGGRAHVSA